MPSGTRLLSAHDPDSILLEQSGRVAKGIAPPEAVLTRLDERFPMNSTTAQFITIFYAVINPTASGFTYASAGHPGAIHLRGSAPSEVLDATGLPIGIGGEPYTQRPVQLEPGNRVYLYTDGVMEAMNANGDQFGIPRLIEGVERGRGLPLQESISSLLAELDAWCGGADARDDISLLAFECE